MVLHPFQKLCYIQSESENSPRLLAASGSYITTFNLVDGSVISTYPRSSEDNSDGGQENDHRPAKRRKLETETNGSLSRQESEESIEIVAERQKGQRRKPKVEISKLPNISHLLSTSNHRYVIAVTTEDKAVNVFSTHANGHLSLESRRAMPKKLCAIVLSPDEQTILAGDKFGDIYSLPLHPTEDYVPKQKAADAAEKIFKPSATELTVHTKGNLQALRQQQEQKSSNSKRELPAFEHKLLLGHVSLLTNVAITQVQQDGKQRQYIITADRDEHIRVSRGLSQAHIIENYCLGHREFVSTIRILPWAPHILLSGGGEPSLMMWKWQKGELLDQESFGGAVEEDLLSATNISGAVRGLDRLAVQGIWTFQSADGGHTQGSNFILVTLEGLPIILSYTTDESHKLKHHQTISLSGNVLDVTVDVSRGIVIASIDTVHQPGSMNNSRPEEIPTSEMFETFELTNGNPNNGQDDNLEDPAMSSGKGIRWQSSSLAIALNTGAAAGGATCEITEVQSSERGRSSKEDYDTLGEFLYGLENLRKKRNWSAEDAEAQEGEEGDLAGGEEQ